MIMRFWVKTHSQLSSNPLFSSIVTLFALILLYIPSHFTRILLSPVLIITAILLLSLLRLGATQSQSLSLRSKPKPTNEDQQWVLCSYRSDSDSDSDSEPEPEPEPSHESHPSFEDSFVQWNLRAPLEVIYEEEEEKVEEEKRDWRFESESESENSSVGDWDSPENVRVDWEEEEEREEGLIEIALDCKSHCDDEKLKGFGFENGFHVDEDNLIEIDISPSSLARFT